MDHIAPEVLLVVLAAAAALLLGIAARVARRSSRDADRAQIATQLASLAAAQERSERALREELARSRSDLASALGRFETSVAGRFDQVGALQAERLEGFARRIGELTDASERELSLLRAQVESQLQGMRKDNQDRLEQIRSTVEEKLQGTLEQRLGESFRQVSDQLQRVHQGLGEMQQLAAGVGDLKKVLSNVKQRGTWGEVQLGVLLEQVLAPAQYEANVATRAGSSERVEFAVRLPGRDEGDTPVWLPIDAKFPQEDYQRLVEAAERGDAEGVDAAARALEQRIRRCARDVQQKYLDPPRTTDFALLFVPTEGLYAEILRRPGIADALQREHRVIVTGPTTLWATLSSLQMGFRTLAIEKRSSDVWRLLAAVKSEFERFGGLLDAVQKKLQEATNKMDEVTRKTTTIKRQLRDVQELPVEEARRLLPGIEEL